jgi:hypothetical protein
MRPPNGVLLTVQSTAHVDGNQLMVEVEISDMTIDEGSHFATVLSRGVYTVARDAKGTWTVVRYRAVDMK